MKLLVKDSGLNNLKASIQYCGECEKPQIHYAADQGWAVCHICGYSAGIEQLADAEAPLSSNEARGWFASHAA